jgi:hypothetical protein
MVIDAVNPFETAAEKVSLQQVGIPRAALTIEEKTRRRIAGLCLYCGEPGHKVADHNLPQRNSANIFHNTMPQAHHYSHSISATVFHNTASPMLCPPCSVTIPHSVAINTFAFIDCGATSLFIDRKFAYDHRIPLAPLTNPIQLSVINGQRLRPVTHQTHRLEISVADIGFSAQLFLIDSPTYPIVLGMAFLRQANPFIDWETLTIHARSPESSAASFTLATTHLEEVGSPGKVFDDTEPPHDAVQLPAQYAEFADVFSKQGAETLPPHRPGVDCAINIEDDVRNLPYKPCYSTSAKEDTVLQSYIKDNLQRGFISNSQSPLGAPILFVKKKDGTLRLCVDYRDLNNITKREPYPLPLIDDILQQLAEAQCYTKIDLRGAYNLVRVRQGDEWKTAFNCKYGHFEYQVMPFGLKNAPASFQRFMNETFQEFLGKFVIIYLDDILIYSKNPDQHEAHVRIVLQKLREKKLFAKLEKCAFGVRRVEFLGYIISPQGVEMDPAKTSNITSWQTPTTVKGVQCFLGFANFYREFIVRYSQLAAPLYALTKKDVPFSWQSNHQEAFDAIKHAFTQAPILAHFCPSAPCVVETDASDFAIGMILSQVQPDGGLRPLAFHSRKFTPAEINYETHDKELLAIVVAVSRWRHYLEGSPHKVKILSDHNNLRYFATSKILNRRQARWSMILSEYDFVIHHRAGSLSGQPDALSRRPEYEVRRLDPVWKQQRTSLLSKDNFNTGPLQLHSIQSTNSHQPLINIIQEAQSKDNTVQQLIRNTTKPFHVHEDLLYRGQALVVPTERGQLEVLAQLHDAPLGGHPGRRKTLQAVKRQFWWSGMDDFIRRYVQSCDRCQRTKLQHKSPSGLLRPLPIPTDLWRSISLDFIVKLPTSNGFNSILVVVDRLSKMAHFIACNESITSPELAELMLRNVFRLHGLPDEIISDRGPQMIAGFWKALLTRLQIERKLSTARHPQTNGQTERVNQVVEQYLRTFTSYQQDDWEDWLAMAEFHYNNTEHSSTQLSPFYANCGFHPRTIDVPSTRQSQSNPSADQRANHLRSIRSFLQSRLRQAVNSMKKHADKHRSNAPTYAIGDMVMVKSTEWKSSRPCPKLDDRFAGPFPISAVINDVAYSLKLPASWRVHNTFHVSQLEPYHDSDIPARVQDRPPEPIYIPEEYSQPLFVVRDVLDSRIYRNQLQYLVDWKGYPPSERSWEPASGFGANSPHLRKAIRKFHQRYPDKPNTGPKEGKVVSGPHIPHISTPGPHTSHQEGSCPAI